MAEKSRRRLMLEQSLADDPADSFLAIRPGDPVLARRRCRGGSRAIARLDRRPSRRSGGGLSAACPVLRGFRGTHRPPWPCCERESRRRRPPAIGTRRPRCNKCLIRLTEREFRRRHAGDREQRLHNPGKMLVTTPTIVVDEDEESEWRSAGSRLNRVRRTTRVVISR